MNNPDDSVAAASDHRQSALLDRILLHLYQAVSATYLLDLAVVCYRLIQGQPPQSSSDTLSMASAKVAAWIAFTLNWSFLALDTKTPRSRGSHLIYHTLGWAALVGAFISAFPYFAHSSQILSSGTFIGSKLKLDRQGFLPSVTGDIFERVMIGTFVLRFGLLSTIATLSVTQLSDGLNVSSLKVPAPLLKDPSDTPTPAPEMASGSSAKKEELEKHKSNEEFKANAFKSLVPKVLLSLRLTYPVGNKKLQLLLLLRAVIMVLERIIHFLVPLHTERILRVVSFESKADGSVSLSKFDVGSVLLYVLYNYLRRHSSILSILRGVAERPLNTFVEDSLRLRFFEHVHSLSMQFHHEKRPRELTTIMHSGVHSVTRLCNTVLFSLVPTMLDIAVTILYFTIVWGWKYGLLIVSNSFLVFIARRFHDKMMSRTYQEMIESGPSRSNPLDTLSNAETVKYFTNEAFEVGRLHEDTERRRRQTEPDLDFEYRLFSFMETLIWTWNLLAGCLLCAYEISHGTRDPTSFMTYVIYSQQLEGPVSSLTSLTQHVQSTAASMDRLLAILNLESTVKDIPDAPPLAVAGGEIEFENVSFQYGPDKKGLSNISFKVPKGQSVGIVGPTGAGKSTILRLLIRFWDPSSGRILIDGQDISKVAQLSVRKNIGIVPQDPVLFDDTIGYNINYGRTTATMDEIEEAAKVAQIHESIMKFKDGYETSVGSSGGKLSGGERQRISVARTVLKNPPIIMLDEATSALDSVTESEVHLALKKMTENRTTVAVAHRLCTVMHCDLILVVKDGEIIERGSHEELIQTAIGNGGKGEYYRMWRIQTGGGGRQCSSCSRRSGDGTAAYDLST
ncbi:ATP-binding cassette sub- B member 6, mitochondrial [Mortierella sp. GBA35]|nr:ATP-binding cassette sub- B member 6, mitochondrial [Mortierella sp. GBA35]